MSQDRIAELASALLQRMSHSRWRGWCFLSLIALLLVAAAVAFVLAGDLSIDEAKKSIRYRASVGVDFNNIASCGETAIVVGDQGTIGVSTDGGEYWRSVESPKAVRLRQASFSKDCSNVVVVGDDGISLYSDDGGHSWHIGGDTGAHRTNSLALSGDGTTAIAVGNDGLLIASYDGGFKWTRHLVLGSEDARDVALSEDGRVAVIAGDNGMAIVLERLESEEFTVSKRDATFQVAGRRKPDFDVALIVESPQADGILRKFVFGRGIFEGDGEWQQRVEEGYIRDATHRAGCFMAVGSHGEVWMSSDGRSWYLVGSGQGEDIDQIALSSDGTRAVARMDDRGLLIGRRHQIGCKQGLDWSFQQTPTDHSHVTHVGGGRFLVVGEKLDTEDGVYSVILSVDVDSGGKPVNVGTTIHRIANVRMDQGDEDQAARGPIEMGVPPREVFWGELLMRGLLRVGVVVSFMFLAAHLFGLARYEFRLATYYAARRDALQLTDGGSFPNPANIDQLDQLMRSMSPEHIEERASSSSVTVDHALQILRGAERYAR